MPEPRSIPLSTAAFTGVFFLAAAGLVGWALGRWEPGPTMVEHRPTASVPPEVSAPAAMPAHVHALVVGGGPYPAANEVQLEDDLALAGQVLGEDGLVTLFAGGPGTRAVRIEDGSVSLPELETLLASIFAAGTARGSTYRTTRLSLAGAATLESTLEILALARADAAPGPLLLYFAGHGDGGDAPESTTALFWGGEELDPTTFADELDAASEGARQLRMVFTSCYSGGFADLAFAGADPERGVTSDDRCGFFATAWDLEASGCDADPDRARHEGYALHFLPALVGHDRDGVDVRGEIDLDGDGTITLAEAHARARIVSRSIDVPTTTSARLVRQLGEALTIEGDLPAIVWPEEEAVRRALGEALDVSGRADAETRFSEVEARRMELDARREEIELDLDDAWIELSRALLSRWPVLDDPWHQDFDATLEAEGAEILAVYDVLPARTRWEDANATLRALDTDAGALDVELALVRRFLEADETLTLAARIAVESPAAWEVVLRMRACEGTAP